MTYALPLFTFEEDVRVREDRAQTRARIRVTPRICFHGLVMGWSVPGGDDSRLLQDELAAMTALGIPPNCIYLISAEYLYNTISGTCRSSASSN